MVAQNPLNIEWRGTLSIEQAVLVHKELLESLQKSSSILLDISDVSDMDTTIIQLVCAALKEAKKDEKDFHITGSVRPDFQKKLLHFGFITKLVDTAEDLERQWCL